MPLDNVMIAVEVATPEEKKWVLAQAYDIPWLLLNNEYCVEIIVETWN